MLTACNCHCGGRQGRDSTGVQLYVQWCFWIDQGQRLGPSRRLFRPFFPLLHPALHSNCMAWHARDGATWSMEEVTWNWKARRAAFPRQILVGYTKTHRAGRRRHAGSSASTDAVRDDCEVFSYSNFPCEMQEQEPGAFFKPFTLLAWF